jgi:hypothetical protein
MKSLALATAFVAMMSMPVAAAVAPVPRETLAVSLAAPPVVEVQDRRLDRRSFDRPRGYDRRRYVPGRRYSRPPSNWRQYRARPRDWRTRGCIVVGPVWFCP